MEAEPCRPNNPPPPIRAICVPRSDAGAHQRLLLQRSPMLKFNFISADYTPEPGDYPTIHLEFYTPEGRRMDSRASLLPNDGFLTTKRRWRLMEVTSFCFLFKYEEHGDTSQRHSDTVLSRPDWPRSSVYHYPDTNAVAAATARPSSINN